MTFLTHTYRKRFRMGSTTSVRTSAGSILEWPPIQPSFAVASIGQWWTRMGRKRYPNATQLFVCADGGGSNGYRVHLWKHELQKFCNRQDMKVTVSHYPPGTSKWNKVEHRLFSYITQNWRGRPLTDYRTVVDLIAATTTKSGLVVKVRLDKKQYEKGKKVPLRDMENLNIRRHTFHGEWNYTISQHSVSVIYGQFLKRVVIVARTLSSPTIAWVIGRPPIQSAQATSCGERRERRPCWSF